MVRSPFPLARFMSALLTSRRVSKPYPSQGYAPQHTTRLSHDETRSAVANGAGAPPPLPLADAPSHPPASTASGTQPAATGAEVETKLKEIARQPRALAGRAQSLDLSSHATPRHLPSQSVDQTLASFASLGLR